MENAYNIGKCILYSFVLNASWISLQSLGKYYECTVQIVFFQYVSHTHLVLACTGSGIEAGGRSHHDGLALVFKLFKAPTAELVGIVDRQFCHGVEGSHRNRRVDTGYAVESVDEALASLYVLIVHIALVLFWRIERGLGYNLSDKGWRKTSLAELHHRLAYLGILGDEGTHTDTALAVTLRY